MDSHLSYEYQEVSLETILWVQLAGTQYNCTILNHTTSKYVPRIEGTLTYRTLDLVVSAIEPDSATIGSQVEVTGRNFVDLYEVSIGSVVTTCTMISENSILVTVPTFGESFVTSRLVVEVKSRNRGNGSAIMTVSHEPPGEPSDSNAQKSGDSTTVPWSSIFATAGVTTVLTGICFTGSTIVILLIVYNLYIRSQEMQVLDNRTYTSRKMRLRKLHNQRMIQFNHFSFLLYHTHSVW
jgi:hypothetical protein